MVVLCRYMVGNVSDCLFYAGGAPIKWLIQDLAGSTQHDKCMNLLGTHVTDGFLSEPRHKKTFFLHISEKKCTDKSAPLCSLHILYNPSTF